MFFYLLENCCNHWQDRDSMQIQSTTHEELKQIKWTQSYRTTKYLPAGLTHTKKKKKKKSLFISTFNILSLSCIPLDKGWKVFRVVAVELYFIWMSESLKKWVNISEQIYKTNWNILNYMYLIPERLYLLTFNHCAWVKSRLCDDSWVNSLPPPPERDLKIQCNALWRRSEPTFSLDLVFLFLFFLLHIIDLVVCETFSHTS